EDIVRGEVAQRADGEPPDEEERVSFELLAPLLGSLGGDPIPKRSRFRAPGPPQVAGDPLEPLPHIAVLAHRDALLRLPLLPPRAAQPPLQSHGLPSRQVVSSANAAPFLELLSVASPNSRSRRPEVARTLHAVSPVSPRNRHTCRLDET